MPLNNDGNHMKVVYLRLLLWNILEERIAEKLLDFDERLMGQPLLWTRK
ncbi:MAG: hypothetical protein NTX75_09375 [Proteobacteria bacterium]|nr:hypothetical protein [Pseudomonadota bacterium]